MAGSANAATYYVDYGAADNTAAGTSTSTPWKYSPGDDRFTSGCTGNCAATWAAAGSKLNAGDRVIFKGGVTYDGSTGHICYSSGGVTRTCVIELQWSGSGTDDANRIIFDGDSGTYATRWAEGTTKAIIDAGKQTTSPQFLFYFDGAYSYITINNFTLTGTKKESYDPMPGLIYNSGYDAHYINITNNALSEAGTIDVAHLGGGCVINLYGDYWYVANNTFTDCGDRFITMVDSSYSDIYNNTMTGIACSGVIIFATSEQVTDFKYRNNTVYNQNKSAPSGFSGQMHANWNYFNSTYGSATPGGFTNLQIYNNVFWQDDWWAATGSWSAGMIHTANSSGSTWDGTKIYNNVMHNPDISGITVGNYTGYNGSTNNTYIYGNTCYSSRSPTCISVGNGSDDPAKFVNLYIKNNNLYNGGTSSGVIKVPYRSEMSGTIGIDYNNYYSNRTSTMMEQIHHDYLSFNTGTSEFVVGETITQGATTAVVYEVRLTGGSWAGGNAAGGILLNSRSGNFAAGAITGSITGAANATAKQVSSAVLYNSWATWQSLGYDANGKGSKSDPLFVSTALDATFDLSPQTGSPVIIAGAVLGSPYDVDINGTSRGSSYDIGAYEYGEPEPDTLPPVLSSLTPSGGIDYTESVTLSVTTNEAATCRHHASSTTWAEMSAMSSTGGTTHTQALATSSGAYTHKVVCQDASSNESDASTWSFTVADQAIPQYVVTISYAGTGIGTTDPASGTWTYDEDATATTTQSPGNYSSFSGWSGTCGCTGTGSCAPTITESCTIIATFDYSPVTLTVSVVGSGGTITSEDNEISCGSLCSANYQGEVITLTASYQYNKTIAWGGTDGGGCSGNTCTITMNAARAVTATFNNLPGQSTLGGAGGQITFGTGGSMMLQ